MVLKALVEEDFIQYKKPSMFLSTSRCSFKCDKESGINICQNSPLAKSPNIEVDNKILISKYLNNPLTHSIVIGGLEPFDTFMDTYDFIKELREYSDDDIVIYTGYYKEEIIDRLAPLKKFNNIIMKYGRMIPNQDSRYDEILGVTLASDNQYGEILTCA